VLRDTQNAFAALRMDVPDIAERTARVRRTASGVPSIAGVGQNFSAVDHNFSPRLHREE
jgi:hypothetical protein